MTTGTISTEDFNRLQAEDPVAAHALLGWVAGHLPDPSVPIVAATLTEGRLTVVWVPRPIEWTADHVVTTTTEHEAHGEPPCWPSVTEAPLSPAQDLVLAYALFHNISVEQAAQVLEPPSSVERVR